MKNNKLISNILLLLTIVFLPVSFSITCLVGEVDIFSIAGIIRYSWIMYLGIPIGALTLLFGFLQKKAGQNYIHLIIVAGICIPLMVIFGSYRFIFREVSFDVSNVQAIEEKINFELPDNVKAATHNFSGYDVSYVKILDQKEANQFASRIRADKRWQSRLSYENKGMLPFDIQFEIDLFDYFLLYDMKSGQYNICPDTDEYRCVFVAYDRELQRLLILDDYAGEDYRG